MIPGIIVAIVFGCVLELSLIGFGIFCVCVLLKHVRVKTKLAEQELKERQENIEK